MASKKVDVVPGSYLEKLVDFVWYGLLTSLWLGLISFMDEFIHKVEKYDYEALPKRSEQTVVLTGGTRGIGLEVVKKLLRLDFRIIIGARNPTAGVKVIDQIRKSGIKSGSVKFFPLDLKSLKSVKQFAQNVLKGAERIDILINNAGIMFEPYELTEDGFESQFQVNYLSHFLLTQLLLPEIKSTAETKSKNCRIINVSSLAHMGSYAANIEDVPNPKTYSAFRAYYDSKLCQVLFAKYLDAQLKSEGQAKVNVYSLHPGVIPTDLYSSLNLIGKLTHMLKMFFRDTDDGSEIILYTAISPELEDEGGSYIANLQCKTPSKVAEDLFLQKLLWNLSEDCINMKK